MKKDNQQTDNVGKVKTDNAYLIVDAAANVIGGVIYADKSEAQGIANKNYLGSHFVVRLDEHLASMQTWYEKGVDNFLRDE